MLDLDLVKKHLNIDKDFKDDDVYIMQLIEVAESALPKHLNITDTSALYDEEGEYKSDIRQAVLLLVGSLYMQRESISYSNTTVANHAYEYLLQLNKSYEF